MLTTLFLELRCSHSAMGLKTELPLLSPGMFLSVIVGLEVSEGD